jgi:hypothetical protein
LQDQSRSVDIYIITDFQSGIFCPYFVHICDVAKLAIIRNRDKPNLAIKRINEGHSMRERAAWHEVTTVLGMIPWEHTNELATNLELHLGKYLSRKLRVSH